MALGLNALGRERRIGYAALYVAASVLAGAVVGLVVSTVGSRSGAGRDAYVLVPVTAVICLVLGNARRWRPIGRRCQVPRLDRTRGPGVRFSVWGAMLGSGVWTLIPYYSFLILVAMELSLTPVQGAVAGGIFGLGRAMPSLIGVAAPNLRPDLGAVILGRMKRPLTVLDATIAVGAAAMVLAAR